MGELRSTKFPLYILRFSYFFPRLCARRRRVFQLSRATWRFSSLRRCRDRRGFRPRPDKWRPLRRSAAVLPTVAAAVERCDVLGLARSRIPRASWEARCLDAALPAGDTRRAAPGCAKCLQCWLSALLSRAVTPQLRAVWRHRPGIHTNERARLTNTRTHRKKPEGCHKAIGERSEREIRASAASCVFVVRVLHSACCWLASLRRCFAPGIVIFLYFLFCALVFAAGASALATTPSRPTCA